MNRYYYWPLLLISHSTPPPTYNQWETSYGIMNGHRIRIIIIKKKTKKNSTLFVSFDSWWGVYLLTYLLKAPNELKFNQHYSTTFICLIKKTHWSAPRSEFLISPFSQLSFPKTPWFPSWSSWQTTLSRQLMWPNRFDH